MSKKQLLPDLSSEQAQALELLNSGENVFLTGGAGSGKSFLVRHFMAGLSSKTFPILASTGAAAVLLGGRTFHSFFGLGIMDGGPEKTFERVSLDNRVLKRISKVEGVIIDEISMIPAQALQVAEEISRLARDSSLPWGGMRVIVVGDFAQLPPVTASGKSRDWCFLSPLWERSGFQPCVLSHNQRVKDDQFLDILADVREGNVSERVRSFLQSRLMEHDEEDFATRLFPRRDQADFLNSKKLEQIPFPEVVVDSIYLGTEKFTEILRKNSPIPPQIRIKEEARVMFVQNDPQKRWVNGTRGWIRGIQVDKIIVEKDNGREVTVEKSQFGLQDSEGNIVASVINFPLILAYATTIHKSQGATIDELWVDLHRLWEPGHAYVALSRLPYGDGLKLLGWSPRSIIVDPQVVNFYRNMKSPQLS
jgi:ATP-dependent exoDNAse (exonuclease V) alpha subunit